MIKLLKSALSEILESINSKTLMITCNDWNEGSYLKSNQNIAVMSVLGLNLGSAGQYTLYQVALAVKILKYEQILLLANYPSKVQEYIIKEFGENQDKYAFAAVLAKTKIELKQDGLVFSDSLFSNVAYLKYQIHYLDNFLEDYTLKMGINKPVIKGMLCIEDQGVFELDDFEIMN